jgi:hypothetical protein
MQRLIPVSDREAWGRCLDRSRHAPAHSWDYCLSIAEHTGSPVYLYECEGASGRVICALLERNYLGHVSVCTLPGFSGVAGEVNEDTWLEQFSEFSVTHNWICAYLGLHPIFAPPGMRRFPTYRAYNQIYAVDISGAENLIKSRMSYNRRREIAELESGYVTIIKDRAAVAQFFKAHFLDFMRSKGATLKQDELWPTTDRFLSAPNAILLGAAKPGGPIEGASVFGYSPHCADFWWGISIGEGARFSTALMWAAVFELRSRGVPILNLGGGARAGDGIAGFKQRFGGVERELGALRLVLQPDVYSQLCGSQALAHDSYFPAYLAL